MDGGVCKRLGLVCFKNAFLHVTRLGLLAELIQYARMAVTVSEHRTHDTLSSEDSYDSILNIRYVYVLHNGSTVQHEWSRV